MIVLGLTGSIGMGKSTASAFFRAERVPVYDADAAVHAVFAKGGAAVEPVRARFPAAVVGDAVDRAILGRMAVDDPGVIPALEAIVHPIVRRVQDAFLQSMALRRAPLVVLDIPLLLETGSEGRCDAVMVVSAPAFVQRRRVLSRPGMTEAKFRTILARQMPDADKRRRADFVVPSNQGMRTTCLAVREVIATLASWTPGAYPPNPNMTPVRKNRKGVVLRGRRKRQHA